MHIVEHGLEQRDGLTPGKVLMADIRQRGTSAWSARRSPSRRCPSRSGTPASTWWVMRLLGETPVALVVQGRLPTLPVDIRVFDRAEPADTAGGPPLVPERPRHGRRSTGRRKSIQRGDGPRWFRDVSDIAMACDRHRQRPSCWSKPKARASRCASSRSRRRTVSRFMR